MYLQESSPASVQEIEQVLSEIAIIVLTRQSVMAPVVHILNRSLQSLAGANSVNAAIASVREVANAYINLTAQTSEQLGRTAIGLLPMSATIMTLSYSAAVAKTLLAAQATGRRLRVICLESRPNLEGLALAEALAEAGLEVIVTTDAACYTNLGETDLFLVGADSLTIDGVLNKIGTAILAVSAQSCNVPGYVLAATNKIWPEGLGQPLLRDYGSDEVWGDSPTGVAIWNHYFDLAPWQAFSGVVTEEGVLEYGEIRQRCKAMKVHPAMSAVIAEVRSNS